MDEKLWQELTRNLRHISYGDSDSLSYLEWEEERIVTNEVWVSEYSAQGEWEQAENFKLYADASRGRAVERYESVIHAAEYSIKDHEKNATDARNSPAARQQYRTAATQLRSLIPQLKARCAQLKTEGALTDEAFRARSRAIADARKAQQAAKQKEQEQQAAVEKVRQEQEAARQREREEQAAELKARQEREAAQQQEQEKRAQAEALRQKKEQAAASMTGAFPDLSLPSLAFFDGQSGLETPILLGTDKQTGAEVVLPSEARQYSLYAIGTTGVGKSTLLEHIAVQDMENGEGLCFLDPHGDSARTLLLRVPLHRQSDVLFWDPKDLEHPLHLNPFYCADLANRVAVDQTVENFISALSSLREFTEVFKQAPQMLDVLRHMAFACVLKPGTTLLESVEFLTNSAFRHTFYGYLLQHKRKDILRYWQWFDDMTAHQKDELTRSSLNKLRRLATTSITSTVFSQYQPTLDLRSLMDEGKILLVDLSGLGEGNGELLGAFLVFALLQAAFARGALPESQRRPFHLYADEFERFMTTAFPQILDEGRKFKLFCVLAHQHRAQLDEASRRSTLNIKNKVVFRVNSLDAEELAPGFSTKPPPQEVTGYQPVRTLSPEPWTHLFALETIHTNPIINRLVDRLTFLFRCRLEYMPVGALTFFSSASTRTSPLHQKYPTVTLPYPFRLFHIDIADCKEGPNDDMLCIGGGASRRSSAEIGNHYLLSCESGKQDEAVFTELVEALATVELPDEEVKLDAGGFYRDPVKHQKLRAVHSFARKVLYHLFAHYLRALGQEMAKAENHIKTESGQYEPQYGPVRTHNDVAAETANRLTLLPKYTAHCIIEEYDELQQESNLVEYDIRTLAPARLPAGVQLQAQQLIDQSRNAFDAANAMMEHEENATTSAFDEHAIITPRTPAYDDSSHPLSPTGTKPPPTQADDEDDPFG